MEEFEFDQIGYWSEIKLDIIKDYAAAYSKILAAQSRPRLHHLYIDGFAGGGRHKSKSSGDFIQGSPANALSIDPPFREYHLIDLDEQKVAALEALAAQREDVKVHRGDCNKVLLDTVLPQARFEKYRRALCVLDPYGLHLDWKVLEQAGTMKSVEIFLNFPVADMNRNVLWRNPQGVSREQQERLTRYWGDDSWKSAAYKPARQTALFGSAGDEKASNQEIAEAFRKRLMEVAGFAHVPEPVAMRNSSNAIVYYLYFAAQKPVAGTIVKDIFNRYRNRRG